MSDFLINFIKTCICFACIDLLLYSRLAHNNELRRKILLDEIETERKERKAIYEAWKKLIKSDIERMEKLKDK